MHGLWTGLLLGGRVGLIRDPSRLFDVLEGLAPDILFCVPQMWAVLHKRFQRREAECVSDEEKKQVHQEVRRLIGHRIKIISAGSAMPAPEVMAWLRIVFPRAEVRESKCSHSLASSFEASEEAAAQATAAQRPARARLPRQVQRQPAESGDSAR